MTTPSPVEGFVVRQSLLKTVFYFLVCLAWFGAGVGLVVLFVTNTPIDDRMFVTFSGFVFGVLSILIVPLFAWRLLRAFLGDHRLVIGPDRIQWVEFEVVQQQVPYANIAVMVYERNFSQGRRIGIDLRDLGNSETLADVPQLRRNKDAFGRHLSIVNKYRRSVKQVHRELSVAWQDWKSERGYA